MSQPVSPPPNPYESPKADPSLSLQGTMSPTKEETTWGMLAHISALAGCVIPFGNVIGPLVIWLVQKDKMPFVDDQGKESLNFQITIAIAILVSLALTVILIGFLLLPVVALFALVMIIIAAIKANGGEVYRYPLCLRLIK